MEPRFGHDFGQVGVHADPTAASGQQVVGAPLSKPAASLPIVQRQSAPTPSKPPSTITNTEAIVRGGPPDFKGTKDRIPVGTRVDVTSTSTTAKGTFVEVVEHGSGKALGWTSQANLGETQYEKAGANFVYEANVKTTSGAGAMLPVMVYLSPKFAGGAADIVVYFHGDAADYAADAANNYDDENPAIGMNLKSMLAGANQILIAPQVNRPGAMKSPWNTLAPGDYESIVQTVLTNLQSDLGLKTAIARGSVSIAGHSGGGKALGQAAKDLDASGRGVADVTLVEAGYGGGEGDGGDFSHSFVLARDWMLEGKPGKVLRVITKASSRGTDTRHAIENNPHPDKDDPTKTEAGRTPVLSLGGVQGAIAAKKLDATLQADQTDVATDPQTRTGGMQLFRKIVVSKKTDPGKGQIQGTIFMYLMTDPPRGKGVDTHFGVRNATVGDIASGQGKGDTFGVKP